MGHVYTLLTSLDGTDFYFFPHEIGNMQKGECLHQHNIMPLCACVHMKKINPPNLSTLVFTSKIQIPCDKCLEE